MGDQSHIEASDSSKPRISNGHKIFHASDASSGFEGWFQDYKASPTQPLKLFPQNTRSVGVPSSKL